MHVKSSEIACHHSRETEEVKWKFDLADTDLAENLGLKDTLQKIWSTIFDF